MKPELTEDEMSFLVECVKMAKAEGFYLLKCRYDFDVEKTGADCLRKIGTKEADIEYCFDNLPTAITYRE